MHWKKKDLLRRETGRCVSFIEKSTDANGSDGKLSCKWQLKNNIVTFSYLSDHLYSYILHLNLLCRQNKYWL